jgi:MHS family proline/betaine transporter-like MFS transporter
VVAVKNYIKVMVACFAGNTLEFFDFALYGAFAPFFATYFFPEPYGGSLTLLAYAASFVLRPLGAIIFGYIGDRYGRKKAFSLPIFLMAVFTLSIPFIPSYLQAGIFSPIALIVCRLGQGLSMGGETAGAVVYSLEHSSKVNKLGFSAGLLGASTLLGALLANFVSFLSTGNYLSQSQWGLPFIMGGLLGFLIAWTRMRLAESPEFQSYSSPHSPISYIIKNHRIAMVESILISGFCGVISVFIAVYFNFYFVRSLGWTIHESLGVVSSSLFLSFVVSILIGRIIEKKDVRKILLMNMLAMILIIFPSMAAFKSGITMYILMAVSLIATICGISWGTLNLLLYSRFPSKVRFTGLAVSDSCGRIVFTAPIPLICDYLTRNGGIMSVAIFIFAVITFMLILLLVLEGLNQRKSALT